MGNWSGAIAQKVHSYSTRYLSDQEIKSLESNFERATKFMNGASMERMGNYLKQITPIMNAWQKVDPSMANFTPFIGTWSYYDSVAVHIYPSHKKGQVCVVVDNTEYRPLNEIYNLGKIQGNKLVSDGEAGKLVFTRKTTRSTRSGKEGIFLAMYSFINGKKGALPLTGERHLAILDHPSIKDSLRRDC